MKKYILTLFAATVATAALAQSHEHTWVGGTTAADGRSCTLKCIDPDCTATETHSHDGLFGCEYCGWALDMFDLKVQYTDASNHNVTERYKLYDADIRFVGSHAFDHYNHVTVDAVRDNIYEPEKSIDFKDIVSITGDAGYSTFRITTAKGNMDFPCKVGSASGMDLRFWINPTQDDIFRLFNITPVDPAPEYMIYDRSVKEIDVSLNEYDAKENPVGIKAIGNYESEKTHYSTDPEAKHSVTPDQFIDAGTYYCWATVSTATVGTRYVPLNDVLAGTFEIERRLVTDPVELATLFDYTQPADDANVYSGFGKGVTVKKAAPIVGLGTIKVSYKPEGSTGGFISAINAGWYDVYASTLDDGKNYKATAPFKVGKFHIERAWIDPDNFNNFYNYSAPYPVYTALPKHAKCTSKSYMTGVEIDGMLYRKVGATGEPTAAVPTEVGTYEFYAVPGDGANATSDYPYLQLGTFTITENSIGEVTKFIDALQRGAIVWGMDVNNDGDVDDTDVEILAGALLK